MAITSSTPTVATRLEEEELRALRELAHMNYRSVAAELRIAVREHIRRQAERISSDG